MKILIAGQWFVSTHLNDIFVPGGTERHVYNLAKQLKIGNYDVLVLSATANKKESGWNLIGDINTYLFHVPEALYGFVIDILSFFNTLKMIITFNPDIVNVLSTRYRFAVGVIVASKIMHKKVVYIRTTLPHKDNRRWVFVFADNLIFCRIIKYADVIISLSKEMRHEMLRDLSPRNIEIIPSFIDTKPFNKNIEKDINSILFVGRLDKLKGIDLLIESLNYVKLEMSDVKLRIVGDGDLRNYLENMVFKHDLDENVIFDGYLQGERLINAYLKSEIFVFPSLREGMPIALLEAMSAGLPIIASNIEPNVEALDDGKYGILVEKSDVNALAQKVVELLKNPELKAYYSKMSLERSKIYSQENVVQRIEDIYLNLIK